MARITYRPKVRSLLAGASVWSLSAFASAQWSVVNLQPPEVPGGSYGYAGYGNGQGGFVDMGGQAHAGMWSGTANSWVDLAPAGTTSSRIYSMHGGQQAGIASVGGMTHAALWSGTAGSWVDLQPPGLQTVSQAFGAHSGQQVGYAIEYVSGIGRGRASLWSGTAASWINLHPGAPSESSFALGVFEGRQAGNANFGGVQKAGTWSGTAASWVELHPAAASASYAVDLDASQQVGRATVGGFGHAALWSGTAESWVDLNPAGSSSSVAGAVDRGLQVGTALVGSEDHAALWTGTAASWTDLHGFLPDRFRSSAARDIWYSGETTYVIGYGFNTLTGRYEAVLWTSAVPEPESVVAVLAGIAALGIGRRRDRSRLN